MDDGIGNIVYIILLILFGITRLLKSNQKKKQAEKASEQWKEADHWETEPKEEKEPTPFENLLERIEEMSNEKEPKPEIEVTIEEEVEEEESLAVQYSKSKMVREELKAENLKESFQRKIHTNIDEDFHAIKAEADTDSDNANIGAYSISEILQNPNGLKKAVILSEILNRKY